MSTPGKHNDAAGRSQDGAGGCSGDCSDVHPLLCELFDPDTPPARVLEIREQIAACPHCFGRLESEQAVRDLVRDCCGEARAPEPLRERIIASITSVSYTEIRYN